MLSVKFYVDSKGDKNGLHPIHLHIRQKGIQVKVSTGIHVEKGHWNNATQTVSNKCQDELRVNSFLDFLKQQITRHIEKTSASKLTAANIKAKVLSLVEANKKASEIFINELESNYGQKERVTFIDLFAGAGGFSEGFLQAETKDKFYDFLLASDINENCELTHRVRYNHQLGLDAEFITQDITEPTFLDNLLKKINNKKVDVVCGGPPCQSFSLAGKRKKFDKKDDLFSHYLNVIRHLRPKYFVMENVKGILTKEGGKIKDLILKEIRSIIDLEEYPKFLEHVSNLRSSLTDDSFLLDCYLLRLQFENHVDRPLQELKEKFIQLLERKFRSLTPKIVDYKTSKTDININSIRRGFLLLQRDKELEYIRKKVINEKANSNLDDDLFAKDFDQFLASIDGEAIVERVKEAFKKLDPPTKHKKEVDDIIAGLEIYIQTFDDCVNALQQYSIKAKKQKEFDMIMGQIRLYKINKPFVALASNYGVPQNRERVLFIGCRKDQVMIEEVKPTVKPHEKVTVFEALYDLDFIENNEEVIDYEEVNLKAKYNGSTEKMKALIRKRAIDGSIEKENGKTFAEWSRKGRLNGRFSHIMKPPVYVKNFQEYQVIKAIPAQPLQNHKTSNQNETVIKRLEVILSEGDYDVAKKKLQKLGLDSDKRNYNVLKPDGQSPTVMTIADDYIHYATPRALTVREMARLQSFDDSFVFQGKRSTGGDKRKSEVPQFTLVGNAVPPLMARAVAMEILKYLR